MKQPAVPSLSEKEAEILSLLTGVGGECYGLDLVKRSEGRLKRGTVYVTLQRMEEKNFIVSRQEPVMDPEIGIARRLYRATGLGQQALQARAMVAAYMKGPRA